MSEIFNKLSSYNIFNYLFPGVIFLYYINNYTIYNVKDNSIIYFLFIAYFSGLIVSRFGSLLESILKNFFLKKQDYNNFLVAELKDKKMPILLEQLNMYRTLLALFILLLVIKLSENYFQINFYIIIFFLILLFIFSYCKQQNYIQKRIEYHNLSFIEKLFNKIIK